MKLCKLLCLFLVGMLLSDIAAAQNIFLQKVEGCNTSMFCLDCGTPKAGYDSLEFAAISENINRDFKLNGNGAIMFQVLVDSVGMGCVLSHTDVSENKITKVLIGYLNACKWTPAVTKSKPTRSSINVLFIIANGKISGKIQRVDQKAFASGLKSSGEPTVYNKDYHYKNASLANYVFTSWNRENSKLPSNLSQHCIVDQFGVLWYDTLDGLIKFDGQNFIPLDDSLPVRKTRTMNPMYVDIKNNLWFGGIGIYSYDGSKWMTHDSTETRISNAYHITGNPITGELLFASGDGLAILKNGKWELLNIKKISQLPSNRIYYAYRDKKERLWIGTFSGSIMIDKNNQVTEFKNGGTPLQETCISSAAEDEQGNVYFSLYAFKKHERDVDEEGIVVFTADGQWMHYNDKNSGLPSNHVNNLFYDKFEKVLWISTHSAGLVRFDLRDNWENYNNKNSGVPSFDVYQVTQDLKGTLYVSTYNGLLKIQKK